MICSRCNNECKDGEKFCHICGNKLIHSSAAPAAPVQPSGSDDTTLLEDVNYEGADETTLLDAPASIHTEVRKNRLFSRSL